MAVSTTEAFRMIARNAMRSGTLIPSADPINCGNEDMDAIVAASVDQRKAFYTHGNDTVESHLHAGISHRLPFPKQRTAYGNLGTPLFRRGRKNESGTVVTCWDWMAARLKADPTANDIAVSFLRPSMYRFGGGWIPYVHSLRFVVKGDKLHTFLRLGPCHLTKDLLLDLPWFGSLPQSMADEIAPARPVVVGELYLSLDTVYFGPESQALVKMYVD